MTPLMTERGSVLQLRDYQRSAVDAVHAAYARGITRQLVSLPTGAGKTFIAAHLVSETNMRTVFMVHRDELARQARSEMRKVNPSLSIGICKADQDELGAQLIIASAATIQRESRLSRLCRAVGPGALFISDEAHHDRAAGRMRAIEAVDPALLVGLTATPMRGDKLGLDAIYQEIVFHLPMRMLVERNHLARPVGLRIETEADLDDVHTVANEFNQGELANAIDTDPRNKLIVDSWLAHAQDRKRTVVFCVSVAHAERVRDAFRAVGVAAEMVEGETPIAERQAIFARFRDGAVSVLTNCMILTEGFDEPGIDCAIMARPTKSTGLYIQQVGRALRAHAGKPDALIIDVVDVTSRHKLVTLPSLSGTEPGKDGERPLSEEDRKAGQVMDLFDTIAHKGKLREREAIMIDLLADSPFLWQALPGGQFMAPAGFAQWLTLLPDGDGFIPVRIHSEKNADPWVEPLLDRSVDADTAMALAESRIPVSALTNKDARWRNAPASEAQLDAAVKWRITIPPRPRRGQMTDLINVAAFRAAMKRLGFNTKGAA